MIGRLRTLIERFGRRYHDWAIATAAKHPFLLLALIPTYVIAWMAFGVFYTLLFLIIMLASGNADQGTFTLTGIFSLAYLAGVLLWFVALLLHYLAVAKHTLKHVLHVENRTILKVTQILAAIVLAFAVCHYYVHLFNDDGAYNGIDVVTSPRGGWENRTGVDRLLHMKWTPMFGPVL